MNSPQEGNSVKQARIATLLIFLICGIGVASWAPMVPLAKQRIGLNEAELGLILLSMGAGAILAMPFMGPVIQKTGSKAVMLTCCIVMAAVLPLLTTVTTAAGLSITLFIYGAAMGSLDVAMNAQAVVIQLKMKKHIMSSFHGMFSVGGLIGSIGLGLLMLLHLTPVLAATVITLIIIIIALTQFRYLLEHPRQEGKTGKFRFPKMAVIVLGTFSFIVFLTEGAMLDWSALFLQDNRNVGISMTGSGYAVFSVAMAVMRFTGDNMVHRFGSAKIVFWGASIAATGILVAVLLPWQAAAMAGFLLIGIGSANIVPVLFSAAGGADKNSPEMALSVVTTMGYAGQLAGPALIGFAAHLISLPVALGLLAIPLFAVAFSFKPGNND